MEKKYKHCPFFVDNTQNVLPQLPNSTQSLHSVVVDVYQLEYMLIHSIKFSDKDRQTYIKVSEQLYKYVLRDAYDYKQFIIRSADAALIDRNDLFDKNKAFAHAVTRFTDTLLPIAADETTYIQQLHDNFYDKLNALVETIYVALTHIRKDTVCLLSQTWMARKQPHYVHNVMVQTCELPLYQAERLQQNNDEYIHLGANTVLVKSCVGLMRGDNKHMYIDAGPHMLRNTLLPYVLTHYDSNNTNVGFRMMLALTPQQEIYIPHAANERVMIVNSDSITVHDVQDANIVYVGGTVKSMKHIPKLQTFAALIKDAIDEMQHIFKDYSGITSVAQRTKAAMPLKQILAHSSLVPLTNTEFTLAEHKNEYNFIPEITIGSCVIKQCIEIVDAFFIMAMHNMRGREGISDTVTCNLHNKVYIVVDDPEQNIYNAQGQHITHMFFKTMSYVMDTLVQHEQNIINKLLLRTSQLDKHALKGALRYLQQLQIHIICPEPLELKTHNVFAKVDKRHLDIVQTILEIPKHLKLTRSHVLQEVIQNTILDPQKAINTLQAILAGHIEYSSHTAVLKQKILSIVKKRTYDEAQFSLLYKKYHLEQANYYNKQHGLDMRVQVCKHKTRLYREHMALLRLEILEQLNIIHNYRCERTFDKVFDTLVQDIQNIHTCLDAHKILACIGDVEHTTKLQADKNNTAHVHFMAAMRCNTEISALYV